jgi:hypothetical protein
MLSTIGRYYTWSGMRSDIHNFCRTCIQCQKRMSANQIVKNPKTSIYPLMTRPFERGPFGKLPTTDGGHIYVLVFKCALTKWVEYFAVKDKSALCIAECFADEILMRNGAPKVLISDTTTTTRCYIFCVSLAHWCWLLAT